MNTWSKNITVIAFGLLALASNLLAAAKVEKNISYGPDKRNVMDVYWDTKYKKAPIVFTIHGGGFKRGDKSYCNKDMLKLYRDKGCIVVSPNYRFMKKGSITIRDCALDCAMDVAYIQANAAKYGGDATKIVASGASAGGYLSAQVAYCKKWDWPADAKYKPKKLNIVGWFGNSPYLPPYVSRVSPPKTPQASSCTAARESIRPHRQNRATTCRPHSNQRVSGARWFTSRPWDTYRARECSSVPSHATRLRTRPSISSSTWSATARGSPREAM